MHNVKQKTRLWLLILAAVLVIAAAGAALWYFRSVYPSLTVELGESLPSPGAFLRRGGRAAYIDPPELDRHTEANYELSLRTALGIRHTTLLVRDSTPPRAEDARLSVLPGELPEPAQTVKNIVDASEVTVHWAEVPDLFTPGPHTLSVLLRDVCGNEARMPVTVTVAEVLDSLSLPVGSPRPEAADFVRYWNGEAAFRTDLGAIDWEHPGAVPIALEVGGKSYGSTLVLTDGDAPVFTLLDFAAALGQELTPEDFVEKCSDLSEVRFSFGSRPDTSRLGEYTVTITAADAAGNSASQSATLYVVEAVATLEAGSEPVYPWQIVRQYGDAFLGYTLPTTDALIPDTPGARTLSLSSWRGDEHTVGLVIRDTLPPEARTAYVECYTGYPCPPEYFIAEVRDASEVTMEFLTEPDWNTVGMADVSILLTDALGHASTATVQAGFVPDTIPPEIHGAGDKYYYVGDAVSYFSGVKAIDNIAPDCDLTVDKSQVDYRSEGRYPVTYTATDPEGNSSSVTVFFTFTKPSVTEEELAAYVDGIFAEILTDGMSLAEQAAAVYDYIFTQVYYIGSTDKSDWRANIYEGLTKGYGDCYTSCMVVWYMFDRLGVDVAQVERYHGWTRHYWVLANLGTGWYHVDACRANPTGRPIYMKTTAELQYLDGDGYFWRFDSALYPEVATTPYEAP